jgi:hypothetical protein
LTTSVSFVPSSRKQVFGTSQTLPSRTPFSATRPPLLISQAVFVWPERFQEYQPGKTPPAHIFCKARVLLVFEGWSNRCMQQLSNIPHSKTRIKGEVPTATNSHSGLFFSPSCMLQYSYRKWTRIKPSCLQKVHHFHSPNLYISIAEDRRYRS